MNPIKDTDILLWKETPTKEEEERWRKAYEKVRKQELEEGIELEEGDFDWTEEE